MSEQANPLVSVDAYVSVVT